MAKKWPPPRKQPEPSPASTPTIYYIARFAEGAKFPFLNWNPLCFSYDIDVLLGYGTEQVSDLCIARCAILSRREYSKPNEFRIEYEFSLSLGWKPPTMLK